MMMKTKRRRDWRRLPTPDCPLCSGTGRLPPFNLYNCAGQIENTEPLSGDCYCVQSAGRRPSLLELEQLRDAMSRVPAQYRSER